MNNNLDYISQINVFAFEATSRDEIIGYVREKTSDIDLKHGQIDLWRKITLARPTSSEVEISKMLSIRPSRFLGLFGSCPHSLPVESQASP